MSRMASVVRSAAGLVAVVGVIAALSSVPATALAMAGKESARLNINTASLQELQQLPRVGPAVAQRIIDYRESNGAFKRTTELLNVKGIGEKTFAGLKDRITVGDSVTK